MQMQEIPQMISQQVEQINPDIKQLALIIFLTILTYIIKRELFRKVIKKIVKSTSTHIDEDLYPFVNRALSIIIFLCGLFFSLYALGTTPKALLTTLGTGSLFLGIVFKNPLSNIFSSLTIMANRRFKIGDIVKLHTREDAKVLSIGLSSCKFYVYGEKDGILIIPNKEIVKSKILNYTYAEEINEKEIKDNG